MEYGRSDDVEQLVERAHLAILREQFGMARTLLDQVVALDPTNPAAPVLAAQIPEPSPARAADDRAVPLHQSVAPRSVGPTDEEASEIARRAAMLERRRLRWLSAPYLAQQMWRVPARFNFSQYPIGDLLRRISRPILCLGFTVGGAILMSLPGANRYGPLPYHLDTVLGAFVGLVIALALLADIDRNW